MTGDPVMHLHANQAQWIEAAVAAISTNLQRDLAEQGRARLLLSGGGTPAPVYSELANQLLAWRDISVALVDERWLPDDERHSNACLVRDTLLVGHAAHARFEPMTGTDVDFDESVALANRASTHSSVVVLGMGPDGHTASLFPGMHNLGEALASPSHYVGVDASGCPGAQGWNKRISLTPAGMASASCRLLLIRGPQKLDLLQTALSGDDMQELPVRAALHLPGSPLQVHWCP